MINLFSIYDLAAQQYIDPFPAPTTEFAIRGFREACTNPEHQFCKFPEDYALYHIGTFDPALGIIEPCEAHKIAMAMQFIIRENT